MGLDLRIDARNVRGSQTIGSHHHAVRAGGVTDKREIKSLSAMTSG
jgi:hypothetical protein